MRRAISGARSPRGGGTGFEGGIGSRSLAPVIEVRQMKITQGNYKGIQAGRSAGRVARVGGAPTPASSGQSGFGSSSAGRHSQVIACPRGSRRGVRGG